MIYEMFMHYCTLISFSRTAINRCTGILSKLIHNLHILILQKFICGLWGHVCQYYEAIMRQFRCAYAEFDKAGARTESCVGFGVHRVL